MRIKEGFVLRTVKDDHVVIGEGLAQVNYNKMLTLNASAAYLWEQVDGRDFTPGELADLLVARYGIAREQALQDADRWVGRLNALDLTEDGMTNQQ